MFCPRVGNQSDVSQAEGASLHFEASWCLGETAKNCVPLDTYTKQSHMHLFGLGG